MERPSETFSKEKCARVRIDLNAAYKKYQDKSDHVQNNKDYGTPDDV